MWSWDRWTLISGDLSSTDFNKPLRLTVQHPELVLVLLVGCDMSKEKHMLSLQLPTRKPIRGRIQYLLGQALNLNDVFADVFHGWGILWV